MWVGVGGGDSLSPPVSTSLISTIFFLNISFSVADIFWYAGLASLFFCFLNRPYAVSHILMGASLNAMSSALLILVHRAGILTSSKSSSAICWQLSVCNLAHFQCSNTLPPEQNLQLLACKPLNVVVQLMLKADDDGECGLAPRVILHPTFLLLLPLCSLRFPPIDLCRFPHVVRRRVLASHYIKLCAVCVCCGNRLLTLACVCDCHHHRGLPLADFVQTKLRPQRGYRHLSHSL